MTPPRKGMVLRSTDGRTALITKVRPDGSVEIVNRETELRFVLSPAEYQRQAARGTVIDSTIESRTTANAVRLGRSMAQAAIARHDKPMTTEQATRAFSTIGLQPWAAQIAADEYTKTWRQRPMLNPRRSTFLRFNSRR